MENLNKEFWDKLKEKYPNAMRVFLKWIEGKEDFKSWAAYANENSVTEEYSRLVRFALAPLIEHLPLAIQFGIFSQFCFEVNYTIPCRGWHPEEIGEIVEKYMIISEVVLLSQRPDKIERYITLDVNKIENIIINSINKVYGSHIGYITKQLKEDLIKHAENKSNC